MRLFSCIVAIFVMGALLASPVLVQSRRASSTELLGGSVFGGSTGAAR